MLKGRFWNIDQSGFIANDSDRTLVNPKFEPVIQSCIDVYRNILGDKLESIYLTGSVSRGIQGTDSDIDFFAVLKSGQRLSEIEEAKISENKASLSKIYPWISKFDLEVWDHNWVFPTEKQFSIFAFVIQVHSILISGSDLSTILPQFRLSPEIARVDISEIHADIVEAILEIEKDRSFSNVKYWSKRICKNIVRACFGLIMVDKGVFTRDIELCAKSFIETYPKYSSDMSRVLEQIRTPTGESFEIAKLLSDIRIWLIPATEAWTKKCPR